MNTSTIRRVQQQVCGAIFATVMTVAMLSGVDALATPKVDNASLNAATQSQAPRG